MLGSVNIIDLLIKTQMADSRSQAKRLVREGAIEWNGKKITDINHEVIMDFKEDGSNEA